MGYFEEARARARRRKSPLNLLLIPASCLPIVLVWAAVVLLAEQAHAHFYPEESLRNGSGPWIVVAVVAPLFAALPLGMLIGNFLVHQLAHVRAVLDREASPDPALSYGESQAALRKVVSVIAIASLAATTFGALLPW
jgi:hypothetical protein